MLKGGEKKYFPWAWLSVERSLIFLSDFSTGFEKMAEMHVNANPFIPAADGEPVAPMMEENKDDILCPTLSNWCPVCHREV